MYCINNFTYNHEAVEHSEIYSKRRQSYINKKAGRTDSGKTWLLCRGQTSLT